MNPSLRKCRGSDTQLRCSGAVSNGQSPFVSTRVVSGRRLVSSEEREIPQVAAWQKLRVKVVDDAASLSICGVSTSCAQQERRSG